MNASNILAVFALGSLALAGVWDALAIVTAHPQATVSHIVRDWTRDYPMIAFFAGLIAGHIWW